jgi:uncharacterized protein (DUF302 family)
VRDFLGKKRRSTKFEYRSLLASNAIPGKGTKMTGDGLITTASRFSVKETIDRLASTVSTRGMTVFGRVDHAANAKQVDMSLRPTEVLIFGNARGGTPLMQARQTIGIDLPLNVLAWEDADGKTWVTTNDPAWLARRHDLGAEAEGAVEAMRAGLAAVTKAAAGE